MHWKNWKVHIQVFIDNNERRVSRQFSSVQSINETRANGFGVINSADLGEKVIGDISSFNTMVT
jgi:hypothetical protein